MEKITVTTLTVHELEMLIIDCVKVVLKHHLDQDDDLPEWLTKAQLQYLLGWKDGKIDEAISKGLIQERYINNMQRFNKNEITSNFKIKQKKRP